MGIEQALYSLRILEKAVKRVGSKNVTGRVMRETLFANSIPSSETFELISDLNFSKDAPFPTKGMTVNIGMVKDGRHVVAATKVPVPKLGKW